MIKYLIIISVLIIAGFGIKFFVSGNYTPATNTSTQTDLPPIEGKSKKLNALEREMLSQPMAGFKVHRNGANLVVTTGSGQETVFQDTETDDNSDLSYLVEYRKTPEVLVIFQEDLEGSSFTYLLPNGTQIPANHYLYPSPSGNRAVQINFSESKLDFNGWTIVEKDGDSFKKVAEQSPTEFKDFVNVGLQFVSWTDENSIEAVIKYSTTQKAEFVTLCAPAKIALVDGKWTLNADLSAAEQDCSEFNISAAPDHIQDLL